MLSFGAIESGIAGSERARRDLATALSDRSARPIAGKRGIAPAAGVILEEVNEQLTAVQASFMRIWAR
jgi:hypothetical protein